MISAARERSLVLGEHKSGCGWLRETFSDAEWGVEFGDEGEIIPGRRNSVCQCPEVRGSVVCLRDAQGARVAGSGEWGQNGRRVGIGQQRGNCGPHHSSGLMLRAIWSYREYESRDSTGH